MNIAIVEDELLFQNQIMEFITIWNQDKGLTLNFKTFFSCRQFLSACNHDYDVVFMDILLPNENGMEAAKNLRMKNKNVNIVFVTSIIDYAPYGYDINALYYILKPLKQDDFNKCMNRIHANTAKHHTYVAQLQNNTYIKIPFDSILYIESQRHYLIIHTDGQQYSIRKNISDIIAELPDYFVRTHRSIIVNIAYIALISRKEIKLSTGQSIASSDSYYEDVAKQFIKYTKKICC